MSFHEPTPPPPAEPHNSHFLTPMPPPSPEWGGYPAQAPSPWSSPSQTAGGLKGASTLAIVGSSVFAVGFVSMSLFNASFDPNSDVSLAAGVLALLVVSLFFLGSIFGYVTLCLWLVKAQKTARAQRYPWPKTWKIWASWFIPFYHFVGPYQVLKTLTYKAGTAGLQGHLALWWSGWLLTLLVDRIGSFGSPSFAVVQATSLISAVTFAASFVGLFHLIRRITEALDSPSEITKTF
jgi:hypothetical protein